MQQRISVVIPALNEATHIGACLSALLPQAQAHGAEVIVVDNNSTDETASIARSYGVCVITEPRVGVVFAMNAGYSIAQGDIIAATDADTIVSHHWLDRIVQNFADPSVVACVGPAYFDRLWWLNCITRTGIYRELRGANMAVRREAFRRVGGFDETVNLATEIHLHDKLKKIGRVVYDRKQTVLTSSRRFRAEPVRQILWHVSNRVHMLLFRKPLFWHFSEIRSDEAELQRRSKQRWWAAGITATLVLTAYYAAWPQSTVFGQILVRDDTKQKMVALTFDDGPNGQATRAMVDILAARHVPATFFMVGRSVAADPTTTKYVTDHGFSIGNHTWDHSFRIPVMSPNGIARELARTSTVIQKTTSITPEFFRPPHGYRSPQLLYEAHREHLRAVDWSVDPQDYNTGNADTITQRVLSSVKPGSIILLHDGLQDGLKVKTLHNREGTIAALPQILDGLQKKGYTIVPLAKLAAKDTHEGTPAEQ